MPEAPLLAHSLGEAHLYLLAAACGACGRGPLCADGGSEAPIPDAAGTLVVRAICESCGKAVQTTFRIAQHPETGASSKVINATDEPSLILDLAQWLTLFRMISETAGREPDKTHARELALEAAQCLEEAMKFYDDAENDLPPAEAFFHSASKERFRAYPEQFSRRRLIHLRSRLPNATGNRPHPNAGRTRRWWRRHS